KEFPPNPAIRGSNHCSRVQYPTLWNNHNSVTNVVTGPVETLDALFVHNADVLTNVRVFVDDCLSDNGSLSDSDVRDSQLPVVFEIFLVLIEIRAHHHYAFKLDVFSDLASNSNDRIEDPCSS